MPASHAPSTAALGPRPTLLALPGVWQADQLGQAARVQPSGHAALDAQLPGGGWPVGALTEVLQPLHGTHEWRLVLPALAQATAGRAGAVVLVAPPHEPLGPALQAQGLPAARCCRVAATGSAGLWASEQALHCRDVIAVLAWLPQAPPSALRRLQLAAAQQGALLWVFRPAPWQHQASPAALRLLVQGGQGAQSAGMQVRILKRRGPPLAEPLWLPAGPARLAAVLAAQAARRAGLPASSLPTSVRAALGSARTSASHALDRIAVAVR
ncbi:hypothetical protein B2J88_15200 [Rhodococcus sp. SRB_17]|nr:hypothetical protein [Rhodococcus sp. SRB_17]